MMDKDTVLFAISARIWHDDSTIDGEYAISIAARKASVHEQTLRHYERLGLIRPARKGTSKNSHRLYSDHDIQRVIYIRQLMHDLGVNLAGVEAILHLHDQIISIRQEAQNRELTLKKAHVIEIDRLKRIIIRLQGTPPQEIDWMIADLDDDGSPTE